MKTKKMGIGGVGPRIILSGVIYAIIAYFVSRFYPGMFNFAEGLSSLNWLIWILVIAGLILWLGSALQLLFAWRKNQLMTTLFYAVFLNPIYDAFIIFLFPALSLYLNNWLYLGLSVVFIVSMRRLIHEEDDYLYQTFGKEYQQYKKRVIFKF